MSTPAQIASACVKQLKAAKQKANLAGKVMPWSEVQAIIEKACMPEAQPVPISANPSQFGDPKVIPPTPEQVTAYSASIGYPMDGQAWCDTYQQKGWMVGRNKMKDWQSACRNWKRSDYAKGGIALPGSAQKPGKDYSKL